MLLHVNFSPGITFCKRLQFVALILLSPLLLVAQDLTVAGTVKDKNNLPLEGVTVVIKGTTRGTSTNQQGRFILEKVPRNGTLVLSYTGFSSQEVSVGGRATIDVSLEEQSTNLNEVVVVGYGTQRKKDLTGAVASVKATQLENENPASVQDILRGNVPGLNISQINAASAKGGGDLLVRGRSSINAGTSPLIVLDGVIYPG